MIGHIETSFEITVDIEANSLPIEYTIREGERQQEVESYLVSMASESMGVRRGAEIKHKKFMRQVLKQLPYDWQKIGCYIEQGRIKLVWSTNIKLPFEPFPVEVTSWDKLPIPEEPPPRLPRLYPTRIRVVKQSPKIPKQHGKINSIKELMEEVGKEKLTRAPKNNTPNHVP